MTNMTDMEGTTDITKQPRVDTSRSWNILKNRILQNTPAQPGTYSTPIKGLSFHRQTSNADPKSSFLQPVIIVVAQGKKLVKIGSEKYHYSENICFVCGVDMPISSCVIEASEEKPFLSMSLQLDTGLISSLASRVPPTPASLDFFRGAMIQEVEPDLLDSFVRLAELIEKQEQIPVMQELLFKEVHYRLLASSFGHVLRNLNTFGSQGNQIARAIAWLKENYKEPLLVEDLASRSNMAPSTFHKYFKEITTLSPLQYQKRLRLAEAQRLMLSASHDVTEAAMAVGYESATQFIREYKRLFGQPPRKDIMSLKSNSNSEPDELTT